MSSTKSTTRFNETLAIMDDQTWIWRLVAGRLDALELEFVRLPSKVPIRQSWNRFQKARRMIIHWEAKNRSGGAVVEEILDVAPNFDAGEHIIVLTTNPTHEDVVYFSELGLRRIVRLRNREKDIKKAVTELDFHLASPSAKSQSEQRWAGLLHQIDNAKSPDEKAIAQFESSLKDLRPQQPSARYIDAMGSILFLRGDTEAAIKNWYAALDRNPNYYRTYHNLICCYRKSNRLKEAMALMQKLQELNKSNISRLVDMGEIQMELADEERAEFYFSSALNRDAFCSGALNGLAEIRFNQGDLEESRRLLSRSHLAYKAASRLNRVGIELVKKNKFKAALDHYTKAQYVLPQQDKGPMLFYNIGLCYSRWGKNEMAKEFLRIALIKEPNYKKAERLLNVIEEKITQESGSAA